MRWRAEAGGAPDQNFVGYCYDTGQGVQQDPRMAGQWYEKASRNGNADGMFNLAVTYDLGEGVTRNPARAVRLYEQAALLGHLPGTQELLAERLNQIEQAALQE